MKSKETCLTRHLQVQPRSHLAGDTCQSLVRELLKHLLYMRNQIPGLFEALDWQIQEQEHERQVQVEHAQLALPHLHADSVSDGPMQPGMLQTPRKKRRLHTSQKRLIKFMQSAHSLLDSVTFQLFTSRQPMHLLIVFGSTPSRPSEVYSLAFPALEQRPEGTPQKAMDDFARRAIRTLVMNTQDLPEGKASAGPTKMFLLIHGQFPEDSISSGFLYKRGFQLRMKKGLQVHMDLTGSAPQTDGSSFLDAAPGDQDGLSWYQCKVVLKGLRSPGSNEVDRTG